MQLQPLLRRWRCGEVMSDTDRRARELQLRPASLQDWDGAIPLLKRSRASFPFIELAVADSGYSAERIKQATDIRVEIVGKPTDQIAFAVHRRRRVIERLFARPGRNRRSAKDFEATIISATALLAQQRGGKVWLLWCQDRREDRYQRRSQDDQQAQIQCGVAELQVRADTGSQQRRSDGCGGHAQLTLRAV
jgi:hypothetical protein